MIDYTSPLIEYYPIDFEVDYSYKVYTWEGHPHLPPLNYSMIKTNIEILDVIFLLEILDVTFPPFLYPIIF